VTRIGPERSRRARGLIQESHLAFIAAGGTLNVQPCPTARVPRKRLPNDASRAYLTFRFNLEQCMIEPRD